jgi:hypothetical protein
LTSGRTTTDQQPTSAPTDRATLDFHPAATLSPVGGPEFGELVADLQEHGLPQPIGLYDGRIRDGRDRAAWSRALGVAGATTRPSRDVSLRMAGGLWDHPLGGDRGAFGRCAL